MRCLFASLIFALATTAYAELPTAAPTQSGVGGWYEFSNAPGVWGWYEGGKLKGRWHKGNRTWEAWDGRRWLPAESPPWVGPANLPGARIERDGINYGLDQSKIGQHGERYWINGTPHEVAEFGSADESKLPQVLVLDPDKRRREEAYAALTANLAGKARVNAADPTNPNQQPFLVGWKLDQDKRFQASGAATFIQGPRDPKDGCAKVVSAIYKPMEAAQAVAEVGARVNKDYDPAQNPGGGGASVINWSWLWGNVIWPVILMLLGAGGAKVAMSGPSPKTLETSAVNVVQDVKAEPADEADRLIAAIQQYEAARLARVEAEKLRAERDARVKEAILALAK